jgi:hypothetical protein
MWMDAPTDLKTCISGVSECVLCAGVRVCCAAVCLSNGMGYGGWYCVPLCRCEGVRGGKDG